VNHSMSSPLMSFVLLPLLFSTQSPWRNVLDYHVSESRQITFHIGLVVREVLSFIQSTCSVDIGCCTEGAAFLCETADGKRSIHSLTSESNMCAHCRPPVSWDPLKPQKVLEHVAQHLLFDVSIDHSLEPCGFCLRLSPSCALFLRRGKGAGSSCQVDEKCSRCPNFHPFAYRSASTESDNSPCTNVPIVCPLCPSIDPAVWKYNMEQHFIKRHSLDAYKQHFPNLSISSTEQAALQKKWLDRHRTRKSKSAKTGVPPLVISEQHTTRNIFL